MKRMIKPFLVFFILLTPIILMGFEVHTHLESSEIPRGGYTYLSIEVIGETRATLKEPSINGLKIRQSGNSSNTRIINGRISKSVTLRLMILGEKEGTYTIPPIEISANKESKKTDSFTINVTNTPSAKKGSSGNQQNSVGLTAEQIKDIAFIKLTTPNTKVFTGEKTPITLELFLNSETRFNQITQYPSIINEAILMDPLADLTSQTVQQVGRYRYDVYRWDTTFTAVKEGHIKLDSEFELSLLVRARSQRNSMSIFDSDFFSPSYQSVPLLAISNELDLEIKSFPENKPKSFTGAIGQFVLKVEASPLEVDAGDPITLNIQIEGKGNFDRVFHEGLVADESFKTYSPEIEFNADPQKVLSGKKVFKQAIIPLSSSVKEIPSIEFTYLDSETGTFETITHAPIPVMVSDSNGTETTTVSKTSNLTETNSIESDGIVSFSLTLPHPNKSIRPQILTRKYQLGLITTPISLVLISFIFSMLTQKRRGEQYRLLKQRQQSLKPLIKEVEQALKNQKPEEYIHKASAYSKQLLSFKLETEAHAITSGDVKNKLLGEFPNLSQIIERSETISYSGFQSNQLNINETHLNLLKEWDQIKESLNLS